MEVDIDSYLAQVEREKAASEDPKDGNKDVNQSSPLYANDDVVPIERMRIIPIYALCTVVLAIGAMLFAEIKIVTYVSSSIAIFISGIALLQGRLIQKSATIRQIQQDLQKEVKRLQSENSKLENEIENLEQCIAKLKGCEGKLQNITSSQGSNTSSFVSLVQECSHIQTQLLEMTKAEILQKLIEVIMQSDRDGNYVISDIEASELITRIKVDPRIDMDEHLFRHRLSLANGELSIHDLIEDLMSAGKQQNANGSIFSFHP